MEEIMIENRFDACMALMRRTTSMFTTWERDFLRDAAEANETNHLTARQVDKLAQIYTLRVLQGIAP